MIYLSFFFLFHCAAFSKLLSFLSLSAKLLGQSHVRRGAPVRVEGRRRSFEDVPTASRNHPQERLHCHQRQALQGLPRSISYLFFFNFFNFLFLTANIVESENI